MWLPGVISQQDLIQNGATSQKALHISVEPTPDMCLPHVLSVTCSLLVSFNSQCPQHQHHLNIITLPHINDFLSKTKNNHTHKENNAQKNDMSTVYMFNPHRSRFFVFFFIICSWGMFAGKKEWIMWDLRSESKKIPMSLSLDMGRWQPRSCKVGPGKPVISEITSGKPIDSFWPFIGAS